MDAGRLFHARRDPSPNVVLIGVPRAYTLQFVRKVRWRQTLEAAVDKWCELVLDPLLAINDATNFNAPAKNYSKGFYLISHYQRKPAKLSVEIRLKIIKLALVEKCLAARWPSVF